MIEYHMHIIPDILVYTKFKWDGTKFCSHVKDEKEYLL